MSRSLAFAFQITVLEKKLSSNAYEVDTLATKMKSEFLERYFGKDSDIQRFALEALAQGRTDVAKEVNRAITVLGTPLDAHRFINQVQHSMKFNGFRTSSNGVTDFYSRIAMGGLVIIACMVLLTVLGWVISLVR